MQKEGHILLEKVETNTESITVVQWLLQVILCKKKTTKQNKTKQSKQTKKILLLLQELKQCREFPSYFSGHECRQRKYIKENSPAIPPKANKFLQYIWQLQFLI